MVNNLVDTVYTHGKYGTRIEKFSYNSDRLTEVFVREISDTDMVLSNTLSIIYTDDSHKPSEIVQTFPNGRTVLTYNRFENENRTNIVLKNKLMKEAIKSPALYTTNISTDYNGIVLFDPVTLATCFDSEMRQGANILDQATKTEMGDTISLCGAAIPVLELGSFPLHVSSKLIIADMAVLVEWGKDLGWEIVPIPRGYYAVTVHGFRKIKGREIIRFGFEFVLSPCNTLPELTANLSMSMQILTL